MNDPPINDLDRIYEKLKVIEQMIEEIFTRLSMLEAPPRRRDGY